ncbi:LuxR C-terminal-related transcriptional regulator [Streptomyces sp. WMMC500]|uniref:ATP-binding protein n=1 Tax=Streptomyces sp. WMMC500 TaxID=3015154 RepID=UPI00248CB443|nr:LuxR C-terminal-related transcriptional regulator [Streptomyces sp. WMMC500]WBB60488.1 LuxR C-terminal-related transcriptional regulator [Streptomyces sp. WMMC500]
MRNRSAGELPAEATSFVGRRQELALLDACLRQARLVTLTGPGGVGKTRTAVRGAHRLRSRFPDGVTLVPLSALADPRLLPNTVAAALDLPEQTALPAEDALAAYLKDKTALLILDTCEHLVDASAVLAEELLRAAPQLHVVATSRQPLDVAGEHILPIPPLAVADSGPADDALQLFTDRAAAAVPGFTVDDDNRADVLALCRRLDGIPLAIELAVSRLRVLSPEEMLNRLDHRFQLLTGGRRTAVPRHQTLRTTIGWSYELSTEPERLLWSRLAVCAGEFSLEVAEAVGAEGALPAEGVLDALIGLVEKSVVLRVESEDGTRYRMLDTIREFGLEQLGRGAEAERTRRRHRDHFLRRARLFDAEWTGDRQVALLRQMVRDQADVRVALEFCVADPDDGSAGLSMATMLWGYWHCTGLLTEGRYWLRRALDRCPEDCPERVKALWLTCWFMDMQGERGDTFALLDEAEAVALRIDDRTGLAWTRTFRHHSRYFRGGADGVAEGFEAARRALTEQGDATGILMSGFLAGFFHVLNGGTGEGIALSEDSLRRNAGTPAELWSRGWALWVKSIGLWLKGEHLESIECARQGIRAKAVLHDLMGVAHFLEGFAWRAAELRHFERVAVLQGAADALWRRAVKEARFGIAVLHDLHGCAADAAREALGNDGYDSAFREGGRLPTDAAVALALADEAAPAAPVVPAQPPGAGDGLTPRQRQVAALVARGLTNREIAGQLVISKRTVDAHVEHILAKFGFTSRSQIPGVLSGSLRTRAD